MKIVIHYDEAEWPIDTEATPERSLEELLDTFTQPQVRSIINENLRLFRGMCDVWNQRELAERRKANLDAGDAAGKEV